MLKDQIRDKYILILSLWILLIFWLRPWSGDLRSDPLTYACISKDMVENNNWFSPQLDGKPYLNKPPLYFWLVGASFKIFGTSFYASKIPALLLATINVFFLYFIVNRLFNNKELAFFSSFIFLSTHWIFKNFTTNRPESLLVFSVLLGVYGFILLKEGRQFSGLLLGLSFAIGFMTKTFFAFFLPLIIVVYGLFTKELFGWLKKGDLYTWIFTGLVLVAPWFIYYEINHPGYLEHLFSGQTLNRFKEGGDVIIDPLMYLKDLIIYYQPWLLFFIIGIAFIISKLKARELNDKELFVLLGFILIFLTLQLSKGKSTRYLTVVTPFMSVIGGFGILSLKEEFKKIIENIIYYGWIPLFIIIWIIPVKINPEKHYVIHIARQIASGKQGDYRKPLAFLDLKKVKKQDSKLIFLSPPDLSAGYSCLYYFYLSDLAKRWDYGDLANWFHSQKSTDLLGSQNGIIILTPVNSVELLNPLNLKFVEIVRDEYFILLSIYKD